MKISVVIPVYNEEKTIKEIITRVLLTGIPEEIIVVNDLPFKNSLLISRALTHRSYINEHPEALEDNERLEFLGDAVLDFISGAWLYNHFPEMAEGEWTRMRSALVRTEQLADLARQNQPGVSDASWSW